MSFHPAAATRAYSHLSVERRVRAAMDWKAAHPAGAVTPAR